MKGLIVKINGKIEEFTHTGYYSLSNAVGGLIETIASARCPETELEYTLWGNEEGRMHAQANNPDFKNNYAAQRVTAYMTGTSIQGLLSQHGNFVVLGVNDEGESVGLSDYLMETIKTLAVSPEEAKKHEDKYDEPFTHFRGFS